MKTELNFDFGLKDLDGNVVQPEQRAGKLLANCLVNQPNGNALKFWEWAVALNKGESLQLDLADKQLLQKFIEECQSITILTKAQLLLALTLAGKLAA